MPSSTQDSVKHYYIVQYIILSVLGMWPLSAKFTGVWELVWDLYYWCILVPWLGSFGLTMLIQIIIDITNLNELIKVLFMFGTLISVFTKYILMKRERFVFRALFADLHDKRFMPQNTSETEKFLKTCQFVRIVRNFYANMSLSALVIFAIANINSDELPMYAYSPLDQSRTWCYRIMYCYQMVGLAMCCIINIAYDSLLTSFLMYLSNQLDMLAERLSSITVENGKGSVKQQLKSCIRYFMDIENLACSVEQLVSLPISVQIFCSVFVLVANFYSISLLTDEMTELIKICIYQSCMLFQIFLICFFADEVTQKSGNLAFELYKSNWVDWSKEERKVLLLMMLRFNTPIRIKSVNRNYSFNLAAFAAIVNSAYSYFALLKRVNN